MQDLISRQAAIDAIADYLSKTTYTSAISFLNTGAMILARVPSAQPELIRCKDCKWKQGSECVRFAEVRPFPDDFCSRAERRNDGSD